MCPRAHLTSLVLYYLIIFCDFVTILPHIAFYCSRNEPYVSLFPSAPNLAHHKVCLYFVKCFSHLHRTIGHLCPILETFFYKPEVISSFALLSLSFYISLHSLLPWSKLSLLLTQTVKLPLPCDWWVGWLETPVLALLLQISTEAMSHFAFAVFFCLFYFSKIHINLSFNHCDSLGSIHSHYVASITTIFSRIASSCQAQSLYPLNRNS